MILNCCSHTISGPFNVCSFAFLHQSRPIVLASNLFIFICPFSQTPRWNFASLSIVDINVDVSTGVSMTADIVTVKIYSIVFSYCNIVYIVNRIAPPDVIVVIRNIVDWPTVEVGVGIIMPWAPFVATDIPIDNTNLRLMPRC